MSTETAAQATESKPRRKKRRWFLRLVLLLLFLLACVVFVLVFFLGTEQGLRTGYVLVQHFAPDLIEIDRLQGRIAGELQLDGMRIRTPATDVDVGRFRLHWEPLELLQANLRILDLSAQDLEVTTKPSAKEPQAEPKPLALPTLVLPLRVELKRGLVEGLRIAGTDGSAPLEITRIEIAAAAQESDLTLHHLSVALPSPEAAAKAEGRVALRNHYPLDLRLSWELQQPPNASLAGEGKIAGDLVTMLIEHSLSGSADVQLKGKLLDVLNDLRWQAELEIGAVDLPAFQADLPAMELGSRLTTEGSLAQARLAGQLQAHAPTRAEYGHLQADLVLLWKEQALVIEELQLRETQSGAELAAQGRWNLEQGPGEFALQARWEQLGWPLLSDRVVDSERGQVQVEGTVDAYRYELTGQVRGPNIPRTTLRAQGEGNLESTRIQRLDLDTLEGQLSLQGKLAWTPVLTWEAALDAKDINPGSQWSDWPGRLGGRVSSQGVLQDEQLALEAAIETLEGQLRGYPVMAAGKARMKGTDVHVDDLSLSSGPSRLQLAGDLGQRLDLTFDLDSPDLRSLLPDAAGAVKAQGSLKGTLEAPEVKARLQASGVDVAGQRIDEATGSIDLGLGAGERVAIDLKAQGLELGGMPWSDASIQGQGKIGDHRLQAALTGEPLAMSLQLSGALGESGAYQGELRGLELRSGDFGDWRLAAPGKFRVAGAVVAAGPLCLQGMENSRICARFEMPGAGSWKADLDVDRLTLALLAPFLPEDMQMEGAVQAKAAFKASDNRLIGEAKLSLPQGKARFQVLDQALDFSNTRVEVSAGQRGLQARLDVPLAGLGGVKGDLRLDGWNLNDPAASGLPLRGQVKGAIDDLSLVTALVRQLDNVQGKLALDMRLGGTLSAPQLNGNGGLRNAGFEVPMLSLNVEGLDVAVESREFETLDINGQLKSGEGVLRLTGGTRVEPEKGLVARLELKGKRLTAVDTPEYFALVSPDVQVQLDKQGLAVTGEIYVPEARIRPRSLPEGSVSPSSDVMIETGASAEEQTRLPTTIDLVARLGKEVNLKGFGVEGDLEGRLRIFQRPGRPALLGDGQLSIVDGTYRLTGGGGFNIAIGRPLTIKQGRLLFAKSPVDNPGLLLLVEREAGDVTAGMRVSGTLKDPKMTFFSDSDPGMSQSEALNYMLTGKGSMSQTSREDTQQGIAVGTYVAPKLYMEYENEPDEKANKVRLRYDLTNKIQIQTETGDQQGIDIFYKIER